MIWYVTKETFLVPNLSKEINNQQFFMKKLNFLIQTLPKEKFITKINKKNSMDSDQILPIKEISL